MAREYFCCYHSYLEVMEQLNDTERGRLFTACLTYSKTGEAPELRGNERFVFPAFRSQIDRDNANYEETCKKRAKSANARWNANDANAYKSIPDDANDAKEKEKEKTKAKTNTKAKERESIPLNPPPKPEAKKSEPDEAAELDRLPAGLREVMGEWLEYKRQRKEKYTPVGLTALISTTINNANSYGENAVAHIVRTSMASGYKGIVWDRLQQNAGRGRKELVPDWANKPSPWEVDAVKRMMEQEQTVGNDPELAARAEQLRERLEGKA